MVWLGVVIDVSWSCLYVYCIPVLGVTYDLLIFCLQSILSHAGEAAAD